MLGLAQVQEKGYGVDRMGVLGGGVTRGARRVEACWALAVD